MGLSQRLNPSYVCHTIMKKNTEIDGLQESYEPDTMKVSFLQSILGVIDLTCVHVWSHV